jgi:Domain of unknown function (DUF4431)
MWQKMMFGLICAIACGMANANECLRYNDEVVIQGRLSRETFAEQPNYENIANGDARATYFFLEPGTPLCVDAGKNELGEVGENHVKIVQLVFVGKEDMFGPLKPFIGQQVRCSGKLMHALTGHHHSRILFSTSDCSSTQSQKN